MNVKQLKVQLLIGVCSTMITVFGLFSATYAWYVSNNTVDASTTEISATTNGFVLQIATKSQGAQHGENNQSLSATSIGGLISPSSTNDLKTWYVSGGWNGEGKVTSYYKPEFKQGTVSQYGSDIDPHYAYIQSEYILYTVSETGSCDVFLCEGEDGKAISVTANGTPTSSTVVDSMRIGITVESLESDGKTGKGDEHVVLVYAPTEVNSTAKGNDNDAEAGWRYVNSPSTTANATYPRIFANTYIYSDGTRTSNYFAQKDSNDNYDAPTTNATPLVNNVGYNGVLMRVYIWLEGTDADCVNNDASKDDATYNITLNLAGVGN